MKITKIDLQADIIDPNISVVVNAEADEFIVTIHRKYSKVYGMGERFDRVEQKGMRRDIKVIEKFCNQGAISYCPVPFFFTDTGFGIYAPTLYPSVFSFGENIEIRISQKSPILYLILGKPVEIISGYYELTGKPLLPPKWSFGVWMSSNRWNSQEMVMEQFELAKKYKLPASVMVIEAWSDEATFYIWNPGKWEDPKGMIESLHNDNIRLVLWQIPAFRKLDAGHVNVPHDEDCKMAIERILCVMKGEEPYVIPEGNWFNGSMLPDFTNPHTVEFWFSKRKHLLDMGVDGFKTDGGEFIYDDSTSFHNGSSGTEMKNAYASSYIKAYSEFIGPQRVLFSRAGYTGQQNYPCQWAGDQESTWDEFRHILTAGLSAGLSGIPYWGFDIAGFAGPLPSVELYERATQFAVFAPIMQWHSEPPGGQFAAIMPSAKGNNDRSPWNIAAVYNDPELIERIRFHTNLRYNLLPYIYNQAIISSETGSPMMKHLIIEYPSDQNVFDIDDSFMLGDLLIFPVLFPMETLQGRKEIYLPKGGFTDLWSGKRYEGERKYTIELTPDRTPVFIRDGACLVLNLGEDKRPGFWADNKLDSYYELCFCPFGKSGNYRFRDDAGNDVTFEWDRKGQRVKRKQGNQDIQIITCEVLVKG